MIKLRRQKAGFKSLLLQTFIVTAVVPILALGLFSLINTIDTLRKNTNTLTQANLTQVDHNITISLDAYKDLAYQLYTDDSVVEWVRKIDEGEDVPATVNQLRRFMNGLLNTKDYIKAITVVTEGGSIITYDAITAVTPESSWIDNYSREIGEVYEEVTSDYAMHVLSTEYATTFANKEYYLFHLAHRIVNYKKLNQRLGMVIISIDEEMLSDIYSTGEGCTYILDEKGMVISDVNKEKIGTYVNAEGISEKKKEKLFVRNSSLSGRWSSAYYVDNEQLGWKIIFVNANSGLVKSVILQALLVAGIAIGILGISVALSLRIAGKLNSDVETVSSGMMRATQGDLNSYIEINDDMAEEIESMAKAYNSMICELKEANEKEREANKRQQEAQITALEAQINPHFLYNTLDTINWMAIEKDEMDISNAINALATILRYAIAKSNAKVMVRDEIEWLKKYIFLQQFRLKNSFRCELDIDPELMMAPIHKLLMQPFIENAIIHGFEDMSEEALIRISMKEAEGKIVICISDNGKGMPKESVEQINRGVIEGTDRQHIGMGNVITRMRMYYGDAAGVSAESTEGKGTDIFLKIPLEKE